MLLVKERKEGKEERKMKEREHDRLLGIANLTNDDKRRVIDPLLGDGGSHKKSKHDKHRK